MSLRPLCLLLLMPILSLEALENPTPPRPGLATTAAPTIAADTPAGPEATLLLSRAACAFPAGSDHFPAPVDLWSDPAAMASRDQVATQISILLNGKLPPGSAFADGFRSLSWEIQAATPSDPDRRHPRYGLLVDHALAPSLASAVSALVGDATAQTIRGFAGAGDGVQFAGAQGERLLIGDPQLLERNPPMPVAVGQDKPTPGLFYHFDFASVLTLVAKLETAGITYNLDPLLPHWRTQAPQLVALVRPLDHGWNSTLSFSAHSLPLHEVDPAFAKLLVDHKQVRALLGITPSAVSQLLANVLTSEDIADLEARIGLPLDRAAECFTGDMALVVQSEGIIPQGCLVLNLQPHTRSQLLATHLAQIWKGQLAPAPAAGTTLWILQTPLGPWELAVSPTRLVCGNDPDLVPRLLEGTVGPATVPAHVVAYLDCDLPALGKQWLPLAWQLLHDAHLALSDDPLQNLSFQLPALATALIQGPPGDHPRLSSLLQHPAPQVRGPDGHVIATMGSPSFPRDLRAMLGAGPAANGPQLETQLDRCVAVFSDIHQNPPQVVAVVVRKADGFHLLESDHGARKPGKTEQQLASSLSGLHLAMGPALEDLQLLEPLPVARMDMRWLPEAAALAAHLLPYRLQVTMDAQGAHADESGEPLAALSCMAATLYLALVEQPRMLLYQERFDAAPGAAVPGVRPPPSPPAGHKVVEF